MSHTIVLVHGAFAESASWDRVIDPLVADGHHVVAAANPLRSLAADAAAVSDLVRTIDGPVAGAQQTVQIAGASHAMPVSRPDVTARMIIEATAPVGAAA